LAFGAVAAFGGTEAEAPDDPNVEFDLGLEKWNRILDEVSDLRAQRKYKQTGHEIAVWSRETALPGPSNAALLYYQALLLRPEPNMATRLEIDEVLKGAKPTKLIRIYLGHCQPMIRTAEAASQMPQCEWGIWHGHGPGSGTNFMHATARHLTYTLAVDARTLAADGHFRTGLARSLTIRRLARHVGDDTVLLYLVSRSLDVMALDTLHHILEAMPPEVDTLMWLRGQLAAVSGAAPSIANPLQNDFESVLRSMRTNPGVLEKIRNVLAEEGKDGQTGKTVQVLEDSELLARARASYSHFLNSVLRTMDSDIPYEYKRAEIERLTNKLESEHGSDPASGYVIAMCAGRLLEWYGLQVRHAAHLSGLKAAVEIYLVMAKTGQLPEKLPSHLPKDPRTGRDFVYEVTDEGFALRCQGKDFQGRGKQRLEFKVIK
jgi:hypothetical protein